MPAASAGAPGVVGAEAGAPPIHAPFLPAVVGLLFQPEAGVAGFVVFPEFIENAGCGL